MSPWSTVVFCLYVLTCYSLVIDAQQDNYWPSVLQKLSTNAEISEFYGLLEKNKEWLRMQNVGMTLFVPTNEAFQKLNISIDKDSTLLTYHMTQTAYDAERLPPTMSPYLAYGGIMLRVTRNEKGVFINNAKLIPGLSQSFGQGRQQKMVHFIDEVLVPLRSKSEDSSRDNPTAWGFLENSDDYKIGSFQIKAFANRVRELRKQDVFRDSTPSTYLIPVDDGLRKVRIESIDDKVIDAHIIPGKQLFLNPTSESESFRTTSYTEFVKISVSFPVDQTPLSRKRFVKSIMLSSPEHRNLAVLSEIVLGNIPIQNGVVHLIRQPLAIIDKTVSQYIEDSAGSPLSMFKEKLRFASSIFRDKLNSPQGVTLFVPSNAAWKNANVERALGGKDSSNNLLENILNLHLVPTEKLTVKQIRDRNLKEMPTLYRQKYIYFNVIVQGFNQTLTVDAGGVNATAVYADIGATNGVIHIIDRVLGIPFTTVGRKVATDPYLNVTYSLGKFQNFNERLDDISQNFTYFVPQDAAWKILNQEYKDLYNAVMTRPDYAFMVLEKHLVISGNYTMADLKKIANETYSLPAARGGLNIIVREPQPGNYVIVYNDNHTVRVSRADVRCTNGIIHVIDNVLISPKDTPAPNVNSARTSSVGTAALLMAALPVVALVFYH